jgi:hypothetical protein
VPSRSLSWVTSAHVSGLRDDFDAALPAVGVVISMSTSGALDTIWQ